MHLKTRILSDTRQTRSLLILVKEVPEILVLCVKPVGNVLGLPAIELEGQRSILLVSIAELAELSSIGGAELGSLFGCFVDNSPDPLIVGVDSGCDLLVGHSLHLEHKDDLFGALVHFFGLLAGARGGSRVGGLGRSGRALDFGSSRSVSDEIGSRRALGSNRSLRSFGNLRAALGTLSGRRSYGAGGSRRGRRGSHLA